MAGRIQLVEGDLTQLSVDAIVNAANSSLLGGGGVDSAIHKAAGPKLYEECKLLNGCATGQAKITKGYNLPARFVIHTVGPIWKNGARGEEQKLADCHRNSLALAVQNGVRTIAFPFISTGAYGFPLDRAARIAFTEVHRFLTTHPQIEQVTFVCFATRHFQVAEKVLHEVLPPG
jgi:O-acetyl-ADP-ribose deacetylase